VLTIDGNSSETIDGATTTTLNTQYEEVTLVCDGTNWHVLDRHIPSTWTTYTPTFTGLGTIVTQSFYWKRIGDTLHVRGTFTTATPTATEARISFPSGLTSASTIGTLEIAGPPAGRNVSSASFFFVQPTREPSTTYFTLSAQQSTTNNMTKRNGDASYGGSESASFEASAPISGWN